MRYLYGAAAAGSIVEEESFSEPYESVHGNATNVTWADISVVDPRAAALYVNVFEENAEVDKFYGCVMPNASALAPGGKYTSWMSAHSIIFKNVTVRGLKSPAIGGCFNCAPGTPCDISLEDTDIPSVNNGSEPPTQAQVICHNCLGDAALSALCMANRTGTLLPALSALPPLVPALAASAIPPQYAKTITM